MIERGFVFRGRYVALFTRGRAIIRMSNGKMSLVRRRITFRNTNVLREQLTISSPRQINSLRTMIREYINKPEVIYRSGYLTQFNLLTYES